MSETILVTKFQPNGDRVLIRRADERDAFEGSMIHGVDSSKEKPAEGEVLAVGQGRRLDNGTLIPISAKVGSTVFFGKYAGTDVEIEGETLVVLRDDEILGSLVEDLRK